MINKYKNILKSVLLSSLATLGTSPTPTIAAPLAIAGKKENESNGESLTEQLNNGELISASEMAEASSHGSHSSHYSHSSHESHSSSSGSSSYGGGSGSGGESAAIAIGATVGGALLVWAITWLVKKITYDTSYSNNNRSVYRKNSSIDYNDDIYSHHSHSSIRTKKLSGTSIAVLDTLGSRELTTKSVGSDVDEMIDSLIANGAIKRKDIVLYKDMRHYKYNRAIKKGVRRMNRRLGYKRSSKASIAFQKDLKSWRIQKTNWISSISDTGIWIFADNDTSRAVAALLVEKGYLKEYDFEGFNDINNKNKLIESFHKFQNENNLKESEYIDLKIISLLYKLPSVD